MSISLITFLPAAFVISAGDLTWIFLLFVVLLLFTVGVIWTTARVLKFLRSSRAPEQSTFRVEDYIARLAPDELEALSKIRRTRRGDKSPLLTKAGILLLMALTSLPALGQSADESLMTQPGILITIVLIAIPFAVGIVFLIAQINGLLRRSRRKRMEREAEEVALQLLADASLDEALERKQKEQTSPLTGQELSGTLSTADPRQLISLSTRGSIPFVASKKKLVKRPSIDPALAKLVIAYLGTAVLWLIFGTTVGEYLGIKFVAPDIDQQSALSFGRLRPVHTNAVFWGWSSLGMIGLGYYIVNIVSNGPSRKWTRAWVAWALINLSVIVGTICLMLGINNGGGEYREYVWPVMAMFAIGLGLVLTDYLSIVARRTTREIYISNWYIISAVMFTMVIAFVAYWPTWQKGLGETIVQGYYMHQGVGMWFMLFTLGIVYYFLPQQLNKPIYSYSLGILAFWTQILFYTVIGTHHFVFSAIPWWLQTVAIVGSAGMVIPVVAGTTNFLMTFKGDFRKTSNSYTLPFFLVGIIFYFTGSMQGTAEAFRYTNLLWHFTDFTVAHSHMTMYGIIAFFLFGSIYALVPRLTGNEPPQWLVGAHFWLAFIGLLLYSVPLMIGGTLKGLMWMEGKPFIDSVTMMVPYWLWRAIGGTMMWISHLIFAYNFYRMIVAPRETVMKDLVWERLKKVEQDAPIVNGV